MSIELLARMNPRGIDYNAVGRGTPTITRENIAHAVANVRYPDESYSEAQQALFKCCVDAFLDVVVFEMEGERERLTNCLISRLVMERGITLQRDDLGKQRLWKTVWAAVNNYCKQGVRISDAEIARNIQVKPPRFCQTWKRYYSAALEELSDIHTIIGDNLSRKLN